MRMRCGCCVTAQVVSYEMKSTLPPTTPVSASTVTL
jgi:hypothetical protein